MLIPASERLVIRYEMTPLVSTIFSGDFTVISTRFSLIFVSAEIVLSIPFIASSKRSVAFLKLSAKLLLNSDRFSSK